MNILHVIAGLDRAAGTSVFCVELCDHLQAIGVRCGIAVRALGFNDYTSCRDVPVFKAVSLETVPFSPDVVHIHALWNPFLHRAAVWAQREGLPVVWSPHGMLTPWALSQKRLKKWTALALYQYWDLRSAALLHATAESEVEDIRRLRLKQPVVIAPLGVTLPNKGCLGHPASTGNRMALFISRVHPKKGLFNLVDAWAKVRPSGWKMVVAGPDHNGHAAEVKARAIAKGVGDDFDLVGPVFGEDKARLYAQADLFVLPTHSENFGVVVLEALAAGVPVITTKGAPWAELLGYGDHQVGANERLKGEGDHQVVEVQRLNEEDGAFSHTSAPTEWARKGRCGWWIEIGVEPLVEALREAMGLSDEVRKAMGENGRLLVERRYMWEAVAEGMRGAYEWILEGGERPESVKVD